MLHHVLTTRAATPRDANSLSWLAAFASRRGPRGQALLAERDGVPVAVIALSSGAVFADPLTSSAAAVSLLRRHRYRLLRQGGDVGLSRNLLRRLAPAA